MKSEFLTALNQICAERSLPREVVLEAIKTALASAYRRNTGAPSVQNILAEIDPETGQALIYTEREVVDTVDDVHTEISLEGAQRIEPEAEIGDEILVESTPSNFGRIAAQTARQVILQRIREAEREAQFAHYVEQEGELVYGSVQSINPQYVTVQLGRTEAVLPRKEQVPGERYTVHSRIRAYVLEVRKTPRGPHIVISRSHQKLLRRMLELEVPEIANGTVEIKGISREAGSRSKVAVAARQPGVDPVGACVGMRGMRIQSIVKELGGEKVDIIEWNSDDVTFIAKSLSPARVLSVQLDEDPVNGRTANVVVPDDQLSLAIGRAGQNARLAAKLTGWRIDIQGATEAIEWALKKINEDPNLVEALGPLEEQVPTAKKALSDHNKGLPYNVEELMAMRQIIEAVRGYYISMRDAQRARLAAEEKARRAALDEARQARRAEIEEARDQIPNVAYEISIADIDLSNRVLGHLERGGLENVGELLEGLAEGNEGLLKIDGIGSKSLEEIQEALDALDLEARAAEMAGEAEAAAAMEAEEAEAEIEPEAEAAELAAEAEAPSEEIEPEEAPAPEAEAEVVELAVEAVEVPEEAEAEATVDETERVAEAETEAEPEEEAVPPVAEAVAPEAPEAVEEAAEEPVEEAAEPEAEEEAAEEEKEDEDEEYDEGWEEEDEFDQRAERRKQQRRRLVYDEELGEVIAIRRHFRDDEEDWERYL
jgi:N utilization substance protein A